MVQSCVRVLHPESVPMTKRLFVSFYVFTSYMMTGGALEFRKRARRYDDHTRNAGVQAVERYCKVTHKQSTLQSYVSECVPSLCKRHVQRLEFRKRARRYGATAGVSTDDQ